MRCALVERLVAATHEEIAGMAGMSRSRLEKALPRFKAAGYVDSLLHIEDRIEGV